VLALLAFYPVSQTIGQLTSASLKATERTVMFARWSFVLSIPDLALTWLLLAPTDAMVPGLRMGAIGLAAKVAVYGLLNVHVFDWVNCRMLNLAFGRLLAWRALGFVVIGGLAFLLLHAGGQGLSRTGLPAAAALAISSAAYFAAMAALVWLWPSLAGITRAQLHEALGWLCRRLPAFVRRNTT
jgi:hypothetical protein